MTTLMEPTLRGSGTITGVFFNSEQDVAAVASAFPLLANPRARAAYGGRTLRYRVALYRRDAWVPFAVFDDLRFPVNDVAFSPAGTSLAIGAGSYDGGFLFEGDLVVWDWQKPQGTRLFNNVPEVVRCRYNASGDQIEAWVRPWDEEWGLPTDDPDAAFDTLYVLRANTSGTSSAAFRPADLELDPTHIAPHEAPPADLHTPEARLKDWFGIHHWTGRGAIKDVAWLDNDRFAIAHEGCRLEIYHRNGERIAAYGGPGHGAEILRGAGLHVHVVETTDHPAAYGRQDSRLYTLTDDGLRLTRAYEGEFTFSATPQGALLGRQNRFHLAGTPARDVLLHLASGEERRLDLGHFDCFNHYIGIRGAPWLFLLQGTPASSHEHKFLCIVQPDGTVRRLWPLLKADRTPASHAMELCGCYVDDALGAGVIICGKHYSPTVDNAYTGFLYRKPLDRDREAWRLPTRASASAIVALPEAGLIAAAFLDGGLQLIDAQTGALRLDAKVRLDGFPTLILAMDAAGGTLLAGTVDGRIAVVEASALCAGATDDARTTPRMVDLD
ncbi:hypothetical protein [Achromobacter sp. Bel]|uniref:hypothetical protein n=1 Tax=Achromobacter sp. Bel TaxID=2727415 RepID=UPI00145E714E|nr:hypothetical protein [Achromobacter sp. Bel]NMK48067.1 hypothetical protein [Achromobacter sp. Bel]